MFCGIICFKSNFSKNTISLTVNSYSQSTNTITTSRFVTTQRAAITDCNFIYADRVGASFIYRRKTQVRAPHSRPSLPISGSTPGIKISSTARESNYTGEKLKSNVTARPEVPARMARKLLNRITRGNTYPATLFKTARLIARASSSPGLDTTSSRCSYNSADAKPLLLSGKIQARYD